MVQRHTRLEVADKAIVHAEAPVRQPTTVDRTFELPTALYAAMATLFFGFVAVMATGFAAPAMAVPTAIIVIFIAMFFAVPVALLRTRPETAQRAKTWARFEAEGIQTAFGHLAAREAMVQVLILPVLLFAWGLAVVTIAALA